MEAKYESYVHVKKLNSGTIVKLINHNAYYSKKETTMSLKLETTCKLILSTVAFYIFMNKQTR